MFQKLLLFVFCVFLFAQTVSAQSPEQKHAASLGMTIVDYYSPFTEDYLAANGAQTVAMKFAYHRNLVGPLNLEIPLRIGGARLPTPLTQFQQIGGSQLLGSLDALLQLQLFKSNHILVPYLSAGVGVNYIEDENTDFQLPLGVGLDIRVADGVYLGARSDYRVSTTELVGTDKNLNSLMHTFGVKFFIGEGTPDPIEPSDRDGDGVSDVLDVCPDIAGVANLQGCPDGDEDGIADKDDACPLVAGEAVFNGCPDTDGDTVQDSEDKCPTVAGLAMFDGCPDTDGDNIQDSEDDCPNVFGVSQFNGCPDTDGDGVADARDKCPDQAGEIDFDGCPDTDGDGIADPNDRCPRRAGKASNEGCPVKEVTQEDQERLDFAAKNLQFETNSSFLKPGSSDRLDEIAEILESYPDYKVNINGYTDNVGRDTYNQWLSERRAERAYNYLMEKGISSSRLSFTGYGEENPIADNGTAAGRKENRRVEFILYLDED
jgi:outer membrane protein OmpA-like peptidoglycan-associated protein